MRRPRALPLALAAVAILAAGCGDDPTTTASGGGPSTTADGTDPATIYTTTSFVLESPEHGPQLCLGGVADSLPPQCGGLDVHGWDWDAVEGEESADGTTWGTFTLVGTYDGEAMTLTEPASAPGPTEEAPDDNRFSTPCPAPDGGWQIEDPATANDAAMSAAIGHARSQPDSGGVWVDQSINPATRDEPLDEMAMNDPLKLVLNLSFTGDLERHEAEVRALWGGALCVSQAPRSTEELGRIRAEVEAAADPYWWSSADEVGGTVEIGVTVDDGLQARFDEQYGAGIVVVHAALVPVAP